MWYYDCMDIKTWTKDEILALLAERDAAVARALVALYERQTADEQSALITTHHNKMGFNGLDARFGSELARKVLKGWTLSPKQLAAARKMLRKYAGQLVLVANQKAAAKAA